MLGGGGRIRADSPTSRKSCRKPIGANSGEFRADFGPIPSNATRKPPIGADWPQLAPILKPDSGKSGQIGPDSPKWVRIRPGVASLWDGVVGLRESGQIFARISGGFRANFGPMPGGPRLDLGQIRANICPDFGRIRANPGRGRGDTGCPHTSREVTHL